MKLKILGLVLSLICCASSISAFNPPKVRSVDAPVPSVDVPDRGWKLWPDRSAQWQAEPAYMPDALPKGDLSGMRPHPPTGGWNVLATAPAKTVTLPTTVEQHFWGAAGLRPYKNEYFYESSDKTPRNGNFIGVSWWYRTVAVPKTFADKTAILHIRGAKQVAEVYVNRHLVGYQFIAETAFDCDVTAALRPGASNQIAIRITNPGGRLDWGDWSNEKIGDFAIFAGHGFGGLDCGITLTAHGPVRFTDSWVLNTQNSRSVTAHAVLRGDGIEAKGIVLATVVDPKTGRALRSSRQEVVVPSSGEATLSIPLTVANADLWDLDHPNLYRMRFDWQGKSSRDERQTTFGFRWFGPSGIGTNAVLRLNGRRIRVYSAISWGFWGMNGLWPTPQLAVKEVRTAKILGLNAINFHRNIARTEALDAADRLGLLRYTEPGGGMTLFWDKESTHNTFQRYMTEKIERMVRDHRSHPSLMVYVVQNELDDDTYKHPLASVILRRIHAEDPSRAAILKSGISPRGEMWMMPYDDTIYVDKGDGYSGWWDEHSVGTPDSWTDGDYTDPEHYVYRNTDSREIADYGEMGGSGTADNHALMVRQIQAMGGASYDLLDHQEIDAAYNRFLDQHGFRSAFPSTDALYRKIGDKQYDYWSHVLQCARLSDETDYLTVSGWETTAIENHSGIVDVMRNPHGDPRVFRDALRPVMPDLQLRSTSLVAGGRSTYDLFFLNDSNSPAAGKIKVALRSPSGTTTMLGQYPVPAYALDVFSYRVASGLITPALYESGKYTLVASFGSEQAERPIYVVKLVSPHVANLAVSGGSRELRDDLAAIDQQAAPYVANRRYEIAICSPLPEGTRTESAKAASNTADPELFRWQRFGAQGDMAFRLAGLPNGPAKVTMGFEEAYWDRPGARIFDFMVNGETVLKDLDVFALAGGKDRVWTTTVDARVSDGTIVVEPGRVRADNAMLSTIRIDAGDKTEALYFGDKPYNAKDGIVWKPYASMDEIPSGLLGQVRNNGMGLLVLASQDSAITDCARTLDHAGVFHFDGLVGVSRAPWMGSWYIVGHHPLYDGLPQDTVMKSDYQVPVGQSNGLLVTKVGSFFTSSHE
jgi:beta-galactosidase